MIIQNIQHLIVYTEYKRTIDSVTLILSQKTSKY